MKIIISLLIVVFLPAMVSAEMSVENYLELKKNAVADEEAKLLLETYITGSGDAISWLNSYVEVRGDKPMYCLPENLELNIDNYLNILDNKIEMVQKELSLNSREFEEFQTLSIQPLLIRGLIKTFPCK